MAFRDSETFQIPDLDVSRRNLLRGGAWLGAGAVLSGLPLGQALLARTPALKPKWPHVRAMVESYVAERKVANMVAVMGWGQREPLTMSNGALTLGAPAKAGPDSLYRIYSMTKPITGMAVMMLIEDGRLKLDQPLAEILPAYANMRVLKSANGAVEDTVPAERPITIRHLLTHTAGLGYNIVQSGPIKATYEKYGLVPGQVSRIALPGINQVEPVRGLANFADRLARVPLVYQPGSKWSYSVSLDLLGRVIEVASGMSFDEFLRTRIFEPVGMTSTWFRVPESETARLTTNYAVFNSTLLPVDPARASIFTDAPAFPFGGAGLVSSPRDYDRFLRMLLGYGVIDGKRVMGEQAVGTGTSNLLPATASTKGTWVDGQGFGAGGRVSDGSYGWGGAAGTVAFVNFKAELRAGMFTQYMPAEAYPVHTGFPKAVMDDVAEMALINPPMVK